MGQSYASIRSDARVISEESISITGIGCIQFDEDVKNKILVAMDEDDLWKLKILLLTFFHSSEMTNVNTFEEMYALIYNSRCYTEEPALLVLELLYRIRRYDLLKIMGCCKHKLENYFHTHPTKLNDIWLDFYNKVENSSISDGNHLISNVLHENSNAPSSSNNTTQSDRQRNESTPETPIDTQPSVFPPGNQLEKYPLEKSPCGYCLIINNENFGDDQLNRKGSSIDKDKLENLFRKFDFNTGVVENLNAMQMKRILEMKSKEDYSKYDVFACCILSHGMLGTVLGVDKKELDIYNDILNWFIKDCKSLVGKPKLFFIQACQGTDPIEYETKSDSICSDSANVVSLYGDYLLFMAAFPGTRAYRNVHEGSWFITHLTNELSQYGHECSLLDILTRVNKHVADEEGKSQGGQLYKQRPLFHCSFTKIFIFKKKQE